MGCYNTDRDVPLGPPQIGSTKHSKTLQVPGEPRSQWQEGDVSRCPDGEKAIGQDLEDLIRNTSGLWHLRKPGFSTTYPLVDRALFCDSLLAMGLPRLWLSKDGVSLPKRQKGLAIPYTVSTLHNQGSLFGHQLQTATSTILDMKSST